MKHKMIISGFLAVFCLVVAIVAAVNPSPLTMAPAAPGPLVVDIEFSFVGLEVDLHISIPTEFSLSISIN